MITISPTVYVPFKKRIRNALIGALTLLVVMGSFYVLHGITSNKSTTSNQAMPPDLKIQLSLFITSMTLLLLAIIVLGQIWILDSLIIDEKRKKLRVLIRKFDTIIDKGEFDINDNLRIRIKSKMNGNGPPIHALIIKYKKRRIFSQSNSNFGGDPRWTKDMYLKVLNEVQKNCQPSIS